MEKDFNAYSPFPKYFFLAKDIHKLALFSYPIHAYTLYENWKFIKWGPTSMGRNLCTTKIGLDLPIGRKKLQLVPQIQNGN